MTRTEFIQAYAARSNLSSEWAGLGFIEIAGSARPVLPCACGDEKCEGWALVGPDSIDSHLTLYAPEPLRSAYCAAVQHS
jgi:hypothetical protein